MEDRNREVNRIHKLLEDAGIKLAVVASDVMGASGRAMLAALVGGATDAETLAGLAKGRLRAKLPELRKALQGRFGEHHAFLLARMLSRVADIEEDIAAVQGRIEEGGRPFRPLRSVSSTRWSAWGRSPPRRSSPSSGRTWGCFPTAAHCASWAKLCPAQHASAGRRRPVGVGHGSRWLRTVLIECAHAAARSKGTYLAERYRILAPPPRTAEGDRRPGPRDPPRLPPGPRHRRGPTSTAAPSSARTRDEEAAKRRAVKALHELGYRVTLTPIPQPAG
ncbi:MAG: hypothetical protein KatS3mg014_0705 [Actinomycetota bacterium]|nr:MAG: hypothetical protein KatS3mg014_0705 [Actinomycetota bacterium]